MTEQELLPGLEKTKTGRIRKLKDKNPKEKNEQEMLIKYCRFLKLSLVYSTQNGIWIPDSKAKFGIIKNQIKAGLNKGIPDICFPYARKGFNSLYIEMKRVKAGVVSQEQIDMAEKLKLENNMVSFCKGFAEAKKVVDWYFER